MNTKEQWIENMMASLDGAVRADPDPLLTGKILQGIKNPRKGPDSENFSLVWKIAAMIVLLVSLNIFTIVHFEKSSVDSTNVTKSVAIEYFSYIGTYNL